MVEINLKDYYYWYITDEFVEISDEVAAELRAGKRYESVYSRRMKRNKVNSLDAYDGLEHIACAFEPSPELCIVLMERVGGADEKLDSTKRRRLNVHERTERNCAARI